MPDNSLMMYKEISKIATFEMLDSGILNQFLYNTDDLNLEPFSAFFERAGHESTLFIANIGIALYIIKMYVIGELLKLPFSRIPFVKRRLDNFANLNNY